MPRRSEWPPGFLGGSVVEEARGLLGCVLTSTVGGKRVSGVIVEAEAYGGPEDPASHAATRGGMTQRNAAMFGPSGRAYVYRIYGMHWCVNVVTGSSGDPQAVLIRGLEPLEGLESMAVRRAGKPLLASGPGRLCQALGITGDQDGHDLRQPPLELETGWTVENFLVGVTGRVGVTAAANWPYRFYVRGSSGVSRQGGVRAKA